MEMDDAVAEAALVQQLELYADCVGQSCRTGSYHDGGEE